jgi:hypothetical protein
MTLYGMEFIRRFALHILPKYFVRIRHYGILSSTSKKGTIPLMREIFKDRVFIFQEDKRIMEIPHPLYCLHCKKESMVIIEIYHPRGPPIPKHLKNLSMEVYKKKCQKTHCHRYGKNGQNIKL